MNYKQLMFIMFALLDFIYLMTALFLYLRNKRFVSNAVIIKATVTAIKPSMVKNKINISVVFHDPMGGTIETTTRVSHSSRYKANETEVELLADPNNLYNVKLNSFNTLWLMPTAMGIMGIMVLFVIAMMVIKNEASLPF